jgi:hypothetical protein
VDNRPFSVADWIKSLHHRIGVPHINLSRSLVCVITTNCQRQFNSFLYRFDYNIESDDSDDATSLLGELSLDENKEVRPLADASKM